MKNVICLILLAMLLGTSAVPSFAQYRKPLSEMNDKELVAYIKVQQDMFEMYTRQTREAMSSFIGQDIDTGQGGLALIQRYYPNVLAWAQAKLNTVVADPMFMPKSTKGEDGIGDPTKPAQMIRDAITIVWSMVHFLDDLGENSIEQDLAGIFRDETEYPNDRIEAMAEMISDKAAQDNALLAHAMGFHATGKVIQLMLWIESNVEWDRRKQLRRYLFPGPQPGPARGAPTGQPGPRGWILGRPGGNSTSLGRVTITTTEGGCATVEYLLDGTVIVIYVPCN